MGNNTVAVRYYNVWIYISAALEREKALIPYLKTMLEQHPQISLKQILEWCAEHELKTTTQYRYRKDYPLLANILNYITYRKVLLCRII